MPRSTPLDPRLLRNPFRVSAGLAAGHSYDRLDGRDLAKPFHGVRSAHALPPHEMYAPLLRPGDRFSHTTAARLWGAPLPARYEEILHVTAGPGLQRPRSSGVVGHAAGAQEATMHLGLPVSSPGTLFLELSNCLGSCTHRG